MSGRFRGKTKWDPLLIIYQILTIQLLGYASLTILIYFASSLSDYTPSITFIFDYRILNVGTGKMIILAHLANSMVGAYLLKFFVERSKSCLDFSLTYYAIHLVLVWHHTKSLPDTFIWYLVNVCGIILMCVGGEFLCRREEMKSIPIVSCV